MWTSKTVLALNQKRLLWRQWTSWRNVFVLWNGQFTPSVPSIFVSKVKSGKQPAARCFLCFFCCCFSLGSLGHRTQSLGQNFFGKPVSGSACVGIPYLCLWSAVIGTEWVQWAIVASLCSVAVDPIQNANRARFGSAPFESRPKNRRTQLRVPREHWPRKCGRRTSPHTRNVRCDATTTTTTTTTTAAATTKTNSKGPRRVRWAIDSRAIGRVPMGSKTMRRPSLDDARSTDVYGSIDTRASASIAAVQKSRRRPGQRKNRRAIVAFAPAGLAVRVQSAFMVDAFRTGWVRFLCASPLSHQLG